MAKIILGTMAGAISGALGNDVFSHNRHGYYVRKRVVPTKVVNTYTTNVRDIMTICSRAWGALTSDQQMAWNTWAQSNPITDRLGQKQVLFGNSAYCQINTRILQSGDSAVALPPVVAAPSPLTGFSIAASEGGGTFVVTSAPTPVAATERIWITLALLTNPGQNYFKNLLKLVKISDLNQATGLDIAAQVEARFGTFQEGHRFVAMASVYESTSGLLSGPLMATGTVAA